MEDKNALPDTDTSQATTDASAPPPAIAPTGDRRERRELILMRAGAHTIALFADEVESVSEARPLTPLPHAPRAVLGVVSLRGRIRTVIDPRPLLDGDATGNARDTGNRDAARDDAPSTAPRAAPRAAHAAAAGRDVPAVSVASVVVALRGDEQLAIAVERVESRIEISPADLRAHAPHAAHVRATLAHHDGRAPVLLLHPSHLFEAAMQGTDRRRQRT